MLDKEKVGRAISEQRKIKGMTQKQLADLLHVSYQAVSRWEQGVSLPSVDMIYDIAKTLETTVDFLLNGLSEERKVIDYLDTGLDTQRLYITKQRLDNLIPRDDSLLHAHYTDPVFIKPAISGMEEPVCVFTNLVPGSKERLAMENGYDREICMDLAASTANNLMMYGVTPAVFQANMVCGNNDGGQILTMGEAFKEVCRESGMLFAGMEVSGQAINYRIGEYRLKAMAMGYVDRKKRITGERIAEGDLIIGLHTDGISSLSYPLVKVMIDRRPDILYARVDERSILIDELMKPSACYVNVIRELIEQDLIHGMHKVNKSLFHWQSHFSMPKGLGAGISLSTVPIPPMFRFLYDLNMMDLECFLDSFAFGIGMMLVIPRAQYERAVNIIEKYHKCSLMGKVERNDERPDEMLWMEGTFKW